MTVLARLVALERTFAARPEDEAPRLPAAVEQYFAALGIRPPDPRGFSWQPWPAAGTSAHAVYACCFNLPWPPALRYAQWWLLVDGWNRLRSRLARERHEETGGLWESTGADDLDALRLLFPHATGHEGVRTAAGWADFDLWVVGWRAAGTQDLEVLTAAGFGAAELELLAADEATADGAARS